MLLQNSLRTELWAMMNPSEKKHGDVHALSEQVDNACSCESRYHRSVEQERPRVLYGRRAESHPCAHQRRRLRHVVSRKIPRKAAQNEREESRPSSKSPKPQT